MSARSVEVPYPIFKNRDGDPLEAGYIYIGTAGLDPEANPIAAYWDEGLTLPATQPIRTLAGAPSNNGAAGRIFVDSDYSLTVRDKNGTLVTTVLTTPVLLAADTISADDGASGTLWTTVQGFINYLMGSMGAAVVGFIQNLTGAVQRTVLQKLRETVSAQDFGAVADWNGSTGTDNSAAIQAAIDAIAEGTIVFTEGDYRIDEEILNTKNNIHLVGKGTVTFVVPPGTNTSTGVGINFYDNVGAQPVNCMLKNINVEISSNSGGNSAGIRWGCSYSAMKNVNSRIRGDNMTGVTLQNDDAGTGPYYNHLDQVFVQGDSSSGTPLTGTRGFVMISSAATPSRSPNANKFTKCRAGGVYNAYDIKGAGNTYDACVSEAINNYHYHCYHPSVASGSTRNVITNPYCEQYPTSTVFECGTNASGCVMIQPYYTGVATVFNDGSTGQNNRLIDTDNLPITGSPLLRAAAKVTGTTVDSGFNIASVAKIAAGTFRVNFTTALSDANFYVTCVAASNDVTARVSVYNTGYIQFFFFDAAGVATDPTGFNVLVLN